MVGTRFNWVVDRDGHYPENAVIGGKTVENETLYIARAMYDDRYIIGKVHPSHRCAYFPYDMEECNLKEYDILVYEKFTSEELLDR